MYSITILRLAKNKQMEEIANAELDSELDTIKK